MSTSWSRLSARALLPHLRGIVGALIPPAAIIIIRHGTPTGEDWTRAGIASGIFVLIAAAEVTRTATTRFRLGDGEFEVRRGFLQRSRTIIRQGQIQRFDTTASPLQRVLGIVTVRIGAAGGTEVALDAVRTATAEHLAARLHPTAEAVQSDDGVIARFQTRWMRFAPLTAWGVAGVGIVTGLAYKAAEAIGVPVEDVWPWIGALGADLGTRTVAEIAALAVAATITLGAGLSLIAFLLEWSRFRLTDDGTTLTLVRGALTTHRLSLPRDRLLGVDLLETVLTRPARAARLAAISAGFPGEGDDEEITALTPTIERAEAVRIAELLLDDAAVSAEEFAPRSSAARNRRHVEALRAGVVLGALAGFAWWLWPELPPILLATAVLGAAAAFHLLAWDEHRRMGHHLGERFLTSRAGVLVTRTTIVDRHRIIGAELRSTWFQRRRHLVTLTLAIAGSQRSGITLVDLDETVAEELAAAVLGAPTR